MVLMLYLLVTELVKRYNLKFFKVDIFLKNIDKTSITFGIDR
jgi:hypothetical protein